MPTVLDHRLWFPDPRSAETRPGLDGLVALGGDLSPPRLLLAYRSGIFPWTANPITWWSPDPRGVLELNQLHLPRRLEGILDRQVAWREEPGAEARPFQLSRDGSFEEVIRECATRRTEGNWITPDFVQAYTRLHKMGHAHSVECWQHGELAGGIYGVAIGGCFAGESMFHRVSNASKIALWGLVQHLRRQGFALLDVQVLNPTTRQLGATNIDRDAYLARLHAAVALPVSF